MKNSSYKFSWVFSSIRRDTPLIQMIEKGTTPQEIRLEVEKLLNPYFEHHEILSDLALSTLLPEAVAIARLSNDTWALDMIQKCLDAHRRARTTNRRASLEASSEWVPETLLGLSIYWSQFHLERDKNVLELAELASECLQNIGAIVEGATKPYLMELLHQLRITRGRSVTTEKIKTIRLGLIISELMRHTDCAELFAPPPWNIPLNQWRNIAQHLTIKIDGDEIIAQYGIYPQITEISLSKEEIITVVTTLNIVFSILKLAHTFYFIDNLREIRELGLAPQDIQLRPEMQILNFALALAGQGFELADLQWNADESIAIVNDVSAMETNTRRFHASQFAYVLWRHTRTPRATIEYWNKAGEPDLRATLGQELCEQVERHEMEFSELARYIELIDLRTETNMPPLQGS